MTPKLGVPDDQFEYHTGQLGASTSFLNANFMLSSTCFRPCWVNGAYCGSELSLLPAPAELGKYRGHSHWS